MRVEQRGHPADRFERDDQTGPLAEVRRRQANHPAGRIDKRPAGKTGVKGGVGPNKALELSAAPRAGRPPERAHRADARREPIARPSDDQAQVTHPRGRGLLNRRQAPYLDSQ